MKKEIFHSYNQKTSMDELIIKPFLLAYSLINYLENKKILNEEEVDIIFNEANEMMNDITLLTPNYLKNI